MSLYEKIRKDLTVLMKKKEVEKVKAMRYIISHISGKEKEMRTELQDSDTIAVLKKLKKQGNDSITKFTAGNRLDLVENEQLSLELIEQYLPQELTKDELKVIVVRKFNELQPSKKEFGKLMGAVMIEVKGLADGNLVKEVVKETLDEQ